MKHLQIIARFPQVIKEAGISRSTIYKQIDNGTFPPPISMGDRAVAFVVKEVHAYINARVRGTSEIQMKALIIDLVNKRGEL